MDVNGNDHEELMARLQQLEHERDELRKDIEQLCMQQAGPSYLAVATRMHFQRTAGLEQEIENLRKKLAACTRQNVNLQEELSEAYRIKTQLADLHRAEAAKNLEAEKQVKFFQGCVASAFAERDHAVMEAEKAKEKEEFMSRTYGELQHRLEELTADCVKQKKLNQELQIDVAKQEEQNEILTKVVDKFYGIKQHSLEGYVNASWDDKCACLLQDSDGIWSYNDTSTSKYISALEEELDSLRKNVDSLRSKLRVGLEIENHLQKKVRELEKKQILAHKMIVNGISGLRHYHAEHKVHVMSLLDEGTSLIQSVTDAVEEKIRQFEASSAHNLEHCARTINADDNECRDVHISIDAIPAAIPASNPAIVSERNHGDIPDTGSEKEGNASEALAQALREKVAALLLLSQQEERHLLERNVNAALQKKNEELQRNLLQVTNEKVKALMELAQLRQEYRQLNENISNGPRQGNSIVKISERKSPIYERDGRLRNILKNTYLKRWIGALNGNEAEAHQNTEGNFPSRRSDNMDFARLKIENATLKESMECMEHLTTSIHRLRLALQKVKESATAEDTVALDDVISEAKLVKTALGSSLPISWSGETDDASIGQSIPNEPTDVFWDASGEKIDSVSAAGFEMVELLILAAQVLKENGAKKGS